MKPFVLLVANSPIKYNKPTLNLEKEKKNYVIFCYYRKARLAIIRPFLILTTEGFDNKFDEKKGGWFLGVFSLGKIEYHDHLGDGPVKKKVDTNLIF